MRFFRMELDRKHLVSFKRGCKKRPIVTGTNNTIGMHVRISVAMHKIKTRSVWDSLPHWMRNLYHFIPPHMRHLKRLTGTSSHGPRKLRDAPLEDTKRMATGLFFTNSIRI